MCTHLNDLLTAHNATTEIENYLDKRYGTDWADRVDLSQNIERVANVIASLDGYRQPRSIDVTYRAMRGLTDPHMRGLLTSSSPLLIGAFTAVVRERQTKAADERAKAAERVADEVTAPAPIVERTPVSA